jgi:hypothetical protein
MEKSRRSVYEEQRRSLPIYKLRDPLLKAIEEVQVFYLQLSFTRLTFILASSPYCCR